MSIGRVGFIGAGQMATALARGLVAAELVDGTAISASDLSSEALEAFAGAVPGAETFEDNNQVVRVADLLVLAVKPQHLESVLAGLAGALKPSTLVVSIAAGITLAKLASWLPAEARIIRVMPNTPCLIGQGASAFSLGDTATPADAESVDQLLSAVGMAHQVPEKLLDAVTGLSGSGPAFVYTMIEALADGGVMMGLPPELAAALAAQTAAGASQMVIATGETPAQLRDRVASPGGTTVAGLNALKEKGLSETLLEAVRAATLRSIELGSIELGGEK